MSRFVVVSVEDAVGQGLIDPECAGDAERVVAELHRLVPEAVVRVVGRHYLRLRAAVPPGVGVIGELEAGEMDGSRLVYSLTGADREELVSGGDGWPERLAAAMARTLRGGAA